MQKNKQHKEIHQNGQYVYVRIVKILSSLGIDLYVLMFI